MGSDIYLRSENYDNVNAVSKGDRITNFSWEVPNTLVDLSAWS
jgi:predicted 2-oxoglutarate/Fe(II)-dependent dioxygenase YbiX